MTLLDIVLAVKIAGTGTLAALPLVLFPAERVSRELDVDVSAIPYLRLYGVALLALLVGYSFGFSAPSGEAFPLGVVCMGVVSNGLGALTLIQTGAYRRNRILTALIAVIAMALTLALFNQEFAMTPWGTRPW